MQKKRKNYKRQRALLILMGLASAALGITVFLSVFNDNLVFFYSPTDLQEKSISDKQRIRIGGLVEENSIRYGKGISSVFFTLTDHNHKVTVHYNGILPALFREGQGIVAEGYYTKPAFQADRLLAKHDENYMPPEVADALKKSGYWKEGAPAP